LSLITYTRNKDT